MNQRQVAQMIAESLSIRLTFLIRREDLPENWKFRQRETDPAARKPSSDPTLSIEAANLLRLPSILWQKRFMLQNVCASAVILEDGSLRKPRLTFYFHKQGRSLRQPSQAHTVLSKLCSQGQCSVEVYEDDTSVGFYCKPR